MLEQSVTLRPHRTERVITAGRLLLALFLVLAIELDRTEPARYAAVVEFLSHGYLAYAAGLFLVTWLRHTTPRHLPLATHIVDLVLFSVVMHLTEGPTSPFFIYFVFATVCGALRWHGRGALLTGIAALAAYVIVAMVQASALFVGHDDFDQTRFITRCTQLAVITLLLAYFGSYQRRLQTEIASLAAWPRRLPARQEDAVHDVLTSAAAILRVPRIVLTWQDDEEPSLRVAVLDGQHVDVSHGPPDAFGTLVAPPLERSSFFCTNAPADDAFVVHRVPGGFASWRGRPLGRAFSDRYAVKSVLALRLATDDIEGYLFALDRATLSTDDLLAGDIVGRLVAGALEQQVLIMRLQDSAAGAERLRLARDLHDGVIQSLTAIGLQVGRLRRLMQHDPAEAERRVGSFEDIIGAELRGLRQVLDDLRPGQARAPDELDVSRRLAELAARLSRQWEVRVDCELARDLPALPASLVREICRMTEEAVVNAVRHGGASEATVQFGRAGTDTMRLAVSYRGRGFATFTGRHDLASLDRMEVGPRTLKERVTALGGDMVITTSEAGATVEIIVGTGART
jgi:signal transduction histidine kinase